MKKRKCPVCKRRFQLTGHGRPARYCSSACRQKAYRNRLANPALRLLQNDLQAIKDRDDRTIAAVKALEDLGYIVNLNRGRRSILPVKPKPHLRIVKEPEEIDPSHPTVEQ